MISRNRTFVTVYLAGACEKQPHTVLSLIPSLQGLEPNVIMYGVSFKFFLRLRRTVLETEGLRASQPVSKKLGLNPVLSFQRLVSKTKLSAVDDTVESRERGRA